MTTPKTITGTIRLPPDVWRKFRELFQYYGMNNKVKTIWLQDLINKKHAQMKAKND
jgi:hypothetical protein